MARHPEIVFGPHDRPLRRDVSLLGSLLGEVLREQAGEALYEREEAARLAARRRRHHHDGAAERRLERVLHGLEPGEAAEVARAFSAYFALVNMAERVHRLRRRRDYLRDPERPQPGSLRAVLADLAAQGVPLAAVREGLAHLRLEPVLTAHPTEAVRRSILTKEQRIARALVDRIEQTAMTPDEAAAVTARLREEITLIWQTEERARVRPSVADEVEHVLFYLTDVVYRVVPPLYEELAAALEETFGEGAGDELPMPLVRFASWVGGDMDGNPNVGADTIRATLERQREMILDRYLGELRRLFGRLSQSHSRVGVADEIAARTIAAQDLLPADAPALPERYREMPYRALVWRMIARLQAARDRAPGAYTDSREMADDLAAISTSLNRHRGRHAGLHPVLRLERRLASFGFHLATLDVRQDALVHRRAVAALLADPGFVDRPAAERTRRLAQALAAGPAGAGAAADAEVARTLDVFRAIAEVRGAHGTSATGPFIVSMATGPDDALAVLYLARRAGLVDAAGGVPLDVAPLFETVDDLAGAGAALAQLLAEPTYRRHLAGRGDCQTVMLGYSDSSKDAGLVASRWALYRAQEDMLPVVTAASADLTFFHGRGGTVGRGGSKPRDAVLAEPPGAIRGRLRVTEQGEIIHAKYGLRGIALRTLELLGGAVLEATLGKDAPAPLPAWRGAAASAATAGRRAYRELVEHRDFLAYFRAATPIDVIERLQIGSRPASRRSGTGLQNLRAIPWVFAWMQSRHVLPGWYGVGSALESAAADCGEEVLTEMAREWPFVTTLLGDVEMVLAKADLGIAARYAALAGTAGETLFPVIRAEYQRTRDWVLRLGGAEELLDREPVLQRSIRLRNPYVDPMSLLQVDLLRRWRAAGRRDQALEDALAVTVRGIARGLQNTG